MRKQKKERLKPRNWTQIAQNIGQVLRKKLIDRHLNQPRSSDFAQSAKSLVKSISKAPILPPFITASQKVIFQNKRIKTQQMTLHYARQNYLRKESFDSHNPEVQFQHFGKQSRRKELSEMKKKEGSMMRSYLGRLRQQRQFNKLINHREKSYKIWRLRADRLVGNGTSQN